MFIIPPPFSKLHKAMMAYTKELMEISMTMSITPLRTAVVRIHYIRMQHATMMCFGIDLRLFDDILLDGYITDHRVCILVWMPKGITI